MEGGQWRNEWYGWKENLEFHQVSEWLTRNSPNEVPKHNGKRITSAKKKAELFAQHYAKVSTLKLSKEERRYKLKLKRLLYDDVNSKEEQQS